MSPLTCPLLALGVLLASDAHVWEMDSARPWCIGFKMSVRRFDGRPIEDVSFDIQPVDNATLHKIADFCVKNGVELQYQAIEVCNDYRGLTSSPKKPPIVHWMDENTMSPIYASCESAPECGPLLIHVSQRCIPDPLNRNIHNKIK